MLNEIRKFINKYEAFLLFIVADIVITIETIWFIELVHLITSKSPSSLLWQGGIGYLLSIFVSYYFIKTLIFEVEDKRPTRFIKYWATNTFITVLWHLVFELTYYAKWPYVFSLILCYVLGKLLMYHIYKNRIFNENYKFTFKWVIFSIVGLLLVPMALQQTFTSAYHLLRSSDYSANVEPTTYLPKVEGGSDSYDPEWGEGYIISMKDEWFEEDPTEFNPDLAYTCNVLSNVSYLKSKWGNDEGEEAIHTLYAALGFDWVNTTSYSYRLKTVDKYVNLLTGESNGAAYVVAGKRLPNDEKLILVSVCGSITLDFIDDLEMGLNRDYETEGHAGFYNAADEIISGFMKNKRFIDDKTIVLFTGHSRGGGVANLAAAMMLERYDEIGIHPTVMAYTLASPTTAGRLKVKEKNYDTIFNVVNPFDLVTYVPFKTMGLTRYGKDIQLIDKYNNKELVDYARSEIKRTFDEDYYVNYSDPDRFFTAMNYMESLYTPHFWNFGLIGNVFKTIGTVLNMGISDYTASHKVKLYLMLIKHGFC